MVYGTHNDWEYKHEDLYQIFTKYQQCNGITKTVPLNTFHDYFSKWLNIKIRRRDRREKIKTLTLKFYTKWSANKRTSMHNIENFKH